MFLILLKQIKLLLRKYQPCKNNSLLSSTTPLFCSRAKTLKNGNSVNRITWSLIKILRQNSNQACSISVKEISSLSIFKLFLNDIKYNVQKQN